MAWVRHRLSLHSRFRASSLVRIPGTVAPVVAYHIGENASILPIMYMRMQPTAVPSEFTLARSGFLSMKGERHKIPYQYWDPSHPVRLCMAHSMPLGRIQWLGLQNLLCDDSLVRSGLSFTSQLGDGSVGLDGQV